MECCLAVIIIASLIALAELKMDVATSTMETDAPEKNLNKWDFTWLVSLSF